MRNLKRSLRKAALQQSFTSWKETAILHTSMLQKESAFRAAQEKSLEKSVLETLKKSLTFSSRLRKIGELLRSRHEGKLKCNLWGRWKIARLQQEKARTQASIATNFCDCELKRWAILGLKANVQVRKFAKSNKNLSSSHSYGKLLRKVVGGWKFLSVYNQKVRKGFRAVKAKVDRRIRARTYGLWKANFGLAHRASTFHSRLLERKTIKGLAKWYPTGLSS